jgi:hypothetical protein
MHYNFITRYVWEVLVIQKQSDEAKAKGKKFSELTKGNMLHHHMDMAGYTAKKVMW